MVASEGPGEEPGKWEPKFPSPMQPYPFNNLQPEEQDEKLPWQPVREATAHEGWHERPPPPGARARWEAGITVR